MKMNTLEMLQKIRKGMVAKCLHARELDYGVYMDDDGSIKWIDEDKRKTDIYLQLTPLVVNEYIWEFEAEKIDVVEAIKIIKDGGVVTCKSCWGVYVYGSSEGNRTLNIEDEIINGKWYKGDVKELL
jgi:hypothetical protein